jgi:hypothetical protein
VSDTSRGTPPNGQPPTGGPRGREQELATVRRAPGAQQAAQPRVAPGGQTLQPRLAPNQPPPTKPLQVPGQPDGARPVPMQPSATQAVGGAMPPPPETPAEIEQRQAAQSGRRPPVPVWDPPAAPAPKRSWKERLGLSNKPNVETQRSRLSEGSVATSGQPAKPFVAPSPSGDGSGATAPITGDRPPERRPAADRPPERRAAADPNGQSPYDGAAVPLAAPAHPASPDARVTDTPAARLDQTTERLPPTAPNQMPAPGMTPAESKPGMLPAVGAATAAAATAAVAAARSGAEKLSANTKPKPGMARRTRKARLRLSRLDPWSVMKTSFLFSIAAGIMLVVAVYTMWTVLESSGLFESVNDIVKSVVSTPGDTTPFRIQDYVNTQKVMGVAALIACVDVVIFTALATLGSFLYNLAATMLGGLEITLAED